jgi:hypothetical protein
MVRKDYKMILEMFAVFLTVAFIYLLSAYTKLRQDTRSLVEYSEECEKEVREEASNMPRIAHAIEILDECQYLSKKARRVAFMDLFDYVMWRRSLDK